MRIVAPEEWHSINGITLEKAALDVVTTEGNLIVEAGPGAGKTELLAQKACYLFSTNKCKWPRKILAISFKKDSAENLKRRVVDRFGSEIQSRFDSYTYDAFAKNLLDRFRLALPEDFIPKADYDVINDYDIIRAAFEKNGFVSQYCSKSKRMNNYNTLINSFNFTFNSISNYEMDSIVRNVWKDLLNGFDDKYCCLTFQMITKLVILLISSNRYVRNALQLTYSHVFLDEFQDSTDLQYDLVKNCFLNSNCQLTAVGDNKQRIMVWAGARKTVFEDYHRDFNAKYFRLLMNHRSAPRLVELQKAMYLSLNDSEDNIIPSEKWNKNDGEVYLLIAENDYRELEWLADNIKMQIKNGVKPSDICVLCKQRPSDYTQGLIAKLAEDGVFSRIENDYQDLLKEPIIRLLLNIIKMSLDTKIPDELENFFSEISVLKGLDLYDCDNKKYVEFYDSISFFLSQCSQRLSKQHSEDIVSEFVNYSVSFLKIEKIKAQYPAYAQGNYFSIVIEKFTDLFSKNLVQSDYDWELAVRSFEGQNSIPIMTIHKSKGLEYSCVYFIGLEDEVFWNFRAQPDEDRSTFFVALSRAKRFVTFTFSKLRNGKCNHRTQINEFYDLLQKPGMAEVINR